MFTERLSDTNEIVYLCDITKSKNTNLLNLFHEWKEWNLGHIVLPYNENYGNLTVLLIATVYRNIKPLILSPKQNNEIASIFDEIFDAEHGLLYQINIIINSCQFIIKFYAKRKIASSEFCLKFYDYCHLF